MGILAFCGIAAFIVAIVTVFKKTWAPVTVPLYAILEGAALGGISFLYNSAYEGIVSQAIQLTIGILLSLLMAYKYGIIKATENFKLGVFAATGGIGIIYLVNFIMSFFGASMPIMDINNASMFENDKLENFSSDSWNKHLNINLKAPAMLTKEFAKNIKGKNNNIINIIDQRVFKLTPFFFSYTLSKTGLYTLTKTSAMSLAPKIRVNGIAPGPTIKNKRQSKIHFKKQYLATPLKQQVNVDEISNAVDFFIKNSSITGQVISIDSGQSLNWQTPDIMEGKE